MSGKRLPRAGLDELGIRVVRQVESGVSPDVIAAALGIGRSTVFKWVADFRAAGEGALRGKRASGRPRKLADVQVAELYGVIVGGDPRMHGFRFALWTRDIVRRLIAARFEVELSLPAVGRLLARMGLSPQRPVYRAYQQSREDVARWRTSVFPALRAEADAAGARIFFANEAAVRSDYHAGTTWAPVGRTPAVVKTGDRFTINMVSAVSTADDIHFDLVEGTFNSAAFIRFCAQVLHDTDAPVWLVVDRVGYHHSKAVMEYVESTEGRLRIIRLPAYSPELNPDEWVWRNIKTHNVGRSAAKTRDEMTSTVLNAFQRLQEFPEIIRGFFKDPNLAYILL
ncbi:IS630 family transposase [Actinokineospora sp. NBRC 105648]|uniref:IS630 family transposase n=1 Tax=Actinokineospora sp. NBRC 105648 TaxID=3032206 RepID=UPI002554AF1F|nr:IS630 family transposase [Actinokineospora sp. NBRC 105648]